MKIKKSTSLTNNISKNNSLITLKTENSRKLKKKLNYQGFIKHKKKDKNNQIFSLSVIPLQVSNSNIAETEHIFLDTS